MNFRIMAATLAAVLAVAACSQKDPAREAIDAAEEALNAIYDDAGKYLPERYAAVKADLDTARAAFGEERYADAIAAVREVPAAAERLASGCRDAGLPALRGGHPAAHGAHRDPRPAPPVSGLRRRDR